MISIGNRTTSLLPKPAPPLPPPGFLLLLHRRLSLLSLSRSRCPLPLSLPRAASSRRGKSAAMADLELEEEEDKEEYEDPKEWTRRKPRGFGDGKEYDTSIEDKLAEEIEQSRRAQAANIAFLKVNPVSSGPNKGQNKPKDIGVGNEDFRVRIFNLPKKKKVERDLKAAFRGVPGLISIVPAVSGNKKTKDPICKGFAFVYFKSKEDAARFARQFSGEAIAFGKIQKTIKCQVMSSKPANSTTHHKVTVAKLPILEEELDDGFAGSDFSFEVTTFVDEFDEDGDDEFDEEDDVFDDDDFDEEDDVFDDDDFIEAEFKDVTPRKESLSLSKSNGKATTQPDTKKAASSSQSPRNQQDKNRASKKKVTPKGKTPKHPKLDVPGSDFSFEVTTFVDEFDEDGDDEEDDVFDEDDFIETEFKDVTPRKEPLSLSKSNGKATTQLGTKKAASSSQSPRNQQDKNRASKKKVTPKGKKPKHPKLDIPGSAKRLQVKEKAVLTEVFAKYASQAALVAEPEHQR